MARDVDVATGDDTRVRVAQQVHEELLSRILSGAMLPEDRITIDAISRDLGISQTPIREALHRLEADGLVVRAHLAGYRVAPRLTKEGFEALVETRVLLEPAAAALAAARAPADQLAHLRELADSMTPAHLDPESERAYATFSQRDAALHHAIAALSGNDFVRDAIVRLHTHAHLFRLSAGTDITVLALEEHAQIVERLVARDVEGASTAMREHIERSAARFRRGFDDA